jgi:Tfp pilus assembly protein PilV
MKTNENIVSQLDRKIQAVIHPHRWGRAGFTLVEIQLTLFILVIAILGMCSMSVMTMKGNVFSRQMTTAGAMATDLLERLQKRDFADTALTAGSHADTANPLNGLYTRTWAVTDSGAASDGTVIMKSIEVTVAWPWLGVNRQAVLKTIVSRPT